MLHNRDNAKAMIALARNYGVEPDPDVVEALMSEDGLASYGQEIEDGMAVAFGFGVDAFDEDWVMWLGMTNIENALFVLLAISPEPLPANRWVAAADLRKANANIDDKNWIGWWLPAKLAKKEQQSAALSAGNIKVGDWLAGEVNGVGVWVLGRVSCLNAAGEIATVEVKGWPDMTHASARFFKLVNRNEGAAALWERGDVEAQTWPGLRSKLYFAQARAVGKANVIGRGDKPKKAAKK